MGESFNKMVKRLEEGTYKIKRIGKNKYYIRDVTQFDGNYGIMSKNTIKRFFND